MPRACCIAFCASHVTLSMYVLRVLPSRYGSANTSSRFDISDFPHAPCSLFSAHSPLPLIPGVLSVYIFIMATQTMLLSFCISLILHSRIFLNTIHGVSFPQTKNFLTSCFKKKILAFTPKTCVLYTGLITKRGLVLLTEHLRNYFFLSCYRNKKGNSYHEKVIEFNI